MIKIRNCNDLETFNQTIEELQPKWSNKISNYFNSHTLPSLELNIGNKLKVNIEDLKIFNQSSEAYNSLLKRFFRTKKCQLDTLVLALMKHKDSILDKFRSSYESLGPFKLKIYIKNKVLICSCKAKIKCSHVISVELIKSNESKIDDKKQSVIKLKKKVERPQKSGCKGGNEFENKLELNRDDENSKEEHEKWTKSNIKIKEENNSHLKLSLSDNTKSRKKNESSSSQSSRKKR